MKKCHKPDCNNEAKGKYCSKSCSATHRFTGNKFQLGKTHSEETKNKISKSGKGQKRSDETKLNIKNSLLGKPHTQERIAKHSERMKGNNFAFDGIGWGASNTKNKKGIALSEEHKNKIKESKLTSQYRPSDETKNKMSKAASKRIFSDGLNHFHIVAGILCQCSGEKKYIEQLLENKQELPKKCNAYIKTPFGVRLPDFEYPDKYVEIKSDWTYKKYIDSDQQKKDEWISKNIKPVEVIIINK